MLLQRLASEPDTLVQTLDGTVVFVDISGFTRLSERLARFGKEGAEHLTDTINSCFTALLADAYAHDGSLLKFGGDALLLWFEGAGHPARACSAAVEMRRTLRSVGRIRAGSGHIMLRMSVGVHSGAYEHFLIGGSHREYVIAGPAASQVVAMEAAASAGQILLSPATAALLPDRCLGERLEPGVLLVRAPASPTPGPMQLTRHPTDAEIAGCLSTEVRAHALTGSALPEHRTATIAFVQFGGTDELIHSQGPAATAQALDELVRIVQDAADRYHVCLLGSDVAGGGGKLLLSAGAPRVLGDDEERMLLALRQVIDARPALPVRIGVNRGHVFAGGIGPHYRRTYTVMGDAVNLGARLMAKAPWGGIYATGGVLERSQAKFQLVNVEPFMVKGKSQPVHASEVGAARRRISGDSGPVRIPLIGRDRELEVLGTAVSQAEEGVGGLVEIVGETGSGKSRLLSEARQSGSAMRFVHATCETLTANVPYVAWRDPLRQLLGLTWEDADEVVLEHLRLTLQREQPELLPWLPLLAIAVSARSPSTAEVDQLSTEFRAAKLHEVVIRFLEPALATPTLVEIEHAHLMDEASSALLRALAGKLRDTSWLVLVTRRDVAGGFAPAPGSVRRLELGPLSKEDALTLAEATAEAALVPPYMLELAVQRSGGSPEFLLDLLAAAASGTETLPDSIDSAASARIDALDPGDRELVRRAAVLGLSFHSGRLRDVQEPDAPELDDAVWQRLQGIFALDPDGHVRFKRPALREVAYDGLPFRLRRSLHQQVAQALEAESGRDADADPAILSLHFMVAGDYERAWKYARVGAERARDGFAHADAARLYRRAIEAGRLDGASEAELAAAWEALADMLQRTGELTAATQALTRARSLVGDDPLAQARLLHRHTLIARRTERLSGAVRWGRRGLRILENAQDPGARGLRAHLLGSLAYTRERQGRYEEAETLCRMAILEAEAIGEQRALAYACYILDLALFESGREEEAIHSVRALEIYAGLGDLEQQANVLNNLGGFAYLRWEWDDAIEFYRLAAEHRERAGDPAEVATIHCNIGEILCDRGRYDEAAKHFRRAHRLWLATEDRGSLGYGCALLGRLEVRAGRLDDGLALLREATESLHRFGDRSYAEFADALLAEAEAIGGDTDRALSIAGELLAGADRLAPLLERVRGIALARIGELDRAQDALAASLSAAREREALYDIAASLDAIERLESDPARARERDAILVRLQIESLPKLPIEPLPALRGGEPAALTV
ncbi:MAG: AAA family ATPase [Actinomycetota bacterium]|nr:AAA family ATPase [Actinomycetota bacterium]